MQASDLIILSGVSGSGKSTALNALEDMGYFCIDNLPAPLIPQFVDFLLNTGVDAEQSDAGTAASAGGARNFALQVNFRGDSFVPIVRASVERLTKEGVTVSLLFFDCQDEVILRRFRETRRPHPLMLARHTVATVSEALAKERELLADLRENASRIIDTSGFTPHDLRRAMEEIFGHERRLSVEIVSFGFKYGVPHDADLVVDVRFLPNPHFVDELSAKTGEEEDVQDYVFGTGEGREFLSRYSDLLCFLIPRYQLEGKRYLTVAVGCTGGRHRSVAVALALAERLKDLDLDLTLRHRDIGRRIR